MELSSTVQAINYIITLSQYFDYHNYKMMAQFINRLGNFMKRNKFYDRKYYYVSIKFVTFLNSFAKYL